MKHQETMTHKIVKNINSALEVIPRALHVEGGKTSRRGHSRKSASTAAKRKMPGAAKKAAARGATRGKRRSVKKIVGRKSSPKRGHQKGQRSSTITARAA